MNTLTCSDNLSACVVKLSLGKLIPGKFESNSFYLNSFSQTKQHLKNMELHSAQQFAAINATLTEEGQKVGKQCSVSICKVHAYGLRGILLLRADQGAYVTAPCSR